MSSVLLMTDAVEPSDHILPALGLLAHQVRVIPADATALLDGPTADLILVDARRDLPGARSLCRVIQATGSDMPVLLILGEGGLAAVAADWGVDDIVLHTAGPGELEARLRLAAGRATGDDGREPEIQHGELLINENSYTATVRGRVLDLTYKEFELLKYLSQHPGRVFTRQQLLQEVWGYDYFGGTRTVDVHVRRLRAKLGSEYESLIGTVRNVGYRLVPPHAERETELA
ncbi:MAG: response regulator transcription factor [Candidatus Nanopelagicales bacterium]